MPHDTSMFSPLTRRSSQTTEMRDLRRTTAKIKEIASHLNLTDDTTRKRLDEAGIKPTATNPERYAWQDIWTRLQGQGVVGLEDEEELRKPLLTAEKVRDKYFPELATRTITDRAKRGALPGVLLGDDWRFVERDVREAARNGYQQSFRPLSASNQVVWRIDASLAAAAPGLRQ